MSLSAAKLVREIGTAFAVLAIYVLTLLAPLHQAAGHQRDLATIGYETVGGWSVCAPLSEQSDDNTQDGLQIKCPAVGIGKNELAAVMPSSLDIDFVTRTAQSAFFVFDAVGQSKHLGFIGQPRGPPALV